jgi:thioredoxin-related protein
MFKYIDSVDTIYRKTEVMKKELIILITCLPILSFAQGIKFENGLTWEQVKEKAKSENKMIFVDCYATWCGPCKEMDKSIYPNDTVGKFMNERFISVKVQMDSSQFDDYKIKLLYPVAREFEKKYNVLALPTFLFFSHEGIIVHKNEGGRQIKEFLMLIKNATDPNKQLYTLLNNWRKGKYTNLELPDLANRIKTEFNQVDEANAIARYYMLNYLDKLPEEEFLKKENLNFLSAYSKIVTINDRIFDAYNKEALKIDEIVGRQDYSKNYILYIITNSFLIPEATLADKKGTAIDWKSLYKRIKLKAHIEYAKRALKTTKVLWYQNKKDYKNAIKSMIEEYNSIGLENFTDDFVLNSRAWYVFRNTTNKRQLKEALAWSERSYEIYEAMGSKSGQSAFFTPNQIKSTRLDTRANILYKLGRRSEAIALEEKAMAINSDTSLQRTLQLVWQKMKAGEPTWPIVK